MTKLTGRALETNKKKYFFKILVLIDCQMKVGHYKRINLVGAETHSETHSAPVALNGYGPSLSRFEASI